MIMVVMVAVAAAVAATKLKPEHILLCGDFDLWESFETGVNVELALLRTGNP